ncbi:hypothetical protein EF908_37190 [Streptomyces sp. WAC04770]|nr:hypothetical protein EF908_37190 [Streptomyces sp. WAC04770]
MYGERAGRVRGAGPAGAGSRPGAYGAGRPGGGGFRPSRYRERGTPERAAGSWAGAEIVWA